MNIGFFELSGLEDFSPRVEQFSIVFRKLNTTIDLFYFNGEHYYQMINNNELIVQCNDSLAI